MKARLTIIGVIILLGALIAFAYLRSGLLRLPDVPSDLTSGDAGLDSLNEMNMVDVELSAREKDPVMGEAVKRANAAFEDLRNGNEEGALSALEEAVRMEPKNLVLGNALRTTALGLKRKWLQQNAQNGEIALQFPSYLQDEPVKFFRGLARSHPSREVKLQLSLALVDHMLLFPALEIKAPASVEAVEILTEIIERGQDKSPYYIPALYARGLNYLFRPFNLVWPERIAAPPNAASTDLSLCVAIGQQVGRGSNKLKGELSLALGDAYAKEGKLSLARSWWQIANNLARDDKFRERVFTRLHWNDDEVSSNLEETFQHQMEDLDHPLSDLRFMWQ